MKLRRWNTLISVSVFALVLAAGGGARAHGYLHDGSGYPRSLVRLSRLRDISRSAAQYGNFGRGFVVESFIRVPAGTCTGHRTSSTCSNP